MTSPMLKKSRRTIMLSVSTAAIIVAGVLAVRAIWFSDGINFRVVGERSDIVKDSMGEMKLLDSTDTKQSEAIYQGSIEDFMQVASSSHQYDESPVSSGEIWNEDFMTIYATPDIDICVGGNLSGLGEMYWQTSNTDVIAGFYDSARTWLGYNSETCRFPVISGYGTTTITAGTYDGKRKDSITLAVVEPPVEQWKREVLNVVNLVRERNDLPTFTWSDTCESAANTRANEIIGFYSHTRPDGSNWDTACPLPENGGSSGENLAVGNAAVSPATTVMLWMNSDSHRANILNPDYTKLAVGFAYDPDSNYKTHWSQFFSTY